MQAGLKDILNIYEITFPLQEKNDFWSPEVVLYYFSLQYHQLKGFQALIDMDCKALAATLSCDFECV